MIIKATKKPVTIEAVKWNGRNIDEIKNFCGDSCKIEKGFERCGIFIPMNRVTIHTLEGDMEASDGDYIIKGVKGEFYPCKPDIFENTYDIVDNAL